MKSTSKITISSIVGLLLVVGVFTILNGWITASPKDTRPPCDQLPIVAKVTAALDNHKELVKELEELGDGIKVEVGRPCPDDQNKGLVLVRYDSKSERDAIKDLLTRSEGFGVPIHLVKRKNYGR